MRHSLISSPLQGYTDFRFRNAFQSYMGGIDVFYAPYIRLDGKQEIKNSTIRDILPKNNQGLILIPQIMTNNAEEFLFVAKQVQELGYDELNWNLGCPYPMVTKRGMGSGLLNNPPKIDEVLQKVNTESDIKISVKMRLGYESNEEIFNVLPVLDKYPLQNIAIHPRIGKQLYKGALDLDTFEKCIQQTRHTLSYNGDITSVAKFHEMAERFPSINHWLIGRGLIADPFLPRMIKNNTTDYPENRIEIFRKFHDTLFNEYQQALSGPSHLLMKMVGYWKYFITAFPNTPKGFKMFKKAKSIKAYDEAVREILANG
ncbi:MAG: tRNA-dihydrouridine synthase family protein [Prolixibacteraceae bacterium]|jgi:tRNA-dihydrouridine synthase B|nr:tRNA-dihydrouridine synthase family protein [Prolixibacteraceae bacterium]